jgi:hypothetical protein
MASFQGGGAWSFGLDPSRVGAEARTPACSRPPAFASLTAIPRWYGRVRDGDVGVVSEEVPRSAAELGRGVIGVVEGTGVKRQAPMQVHGLRRSKTAAQENPPNWAFLVHSAGVEPTTS